MLQTVTLGFHSCTSMRFEYHVTCVWRSCFWLILLLLKLVTCLLTLYISFSYILLHQRPQIFILHFTLNFVSLCYVSMSRLIFSNYCFYLLKLSHWMLGIIAFKLCAGFIQCLSLLIQCDIMQRFDLDIVSYFSYFETK